jgi:hypothetical protein
MFGFSEGRGRTRFGIRILSLKVKVSRTLTDLRHASQLHDRTLPLAICERGSLVAVGISSGKHSAVIVENLCLEMMMFAPLVLSEARAFAVCVHSADSTMALPNIDCRVNLEYT